MQEAQGVSLSYAQFWSPRETTLLLAQQQEEIHTKINELASIFPDAKTSPGLVTSSTTAIVSFNLHASRIFTAYAACMGYLEHLLRTQLTDAIGRVLTPADFDQYMAWHQRKLLEAEYRLHPFSYAIRRKGHYPEGVLQLEACNADGHSEPVLAQVYTQPHPFPFKFALSASAEVVMNGKNKNFTLALHM